MVKTLVTIAALLALAACGESTSDKQKTWIGLSDTALLAHAGAPDLQAEAGNGGRVLTYYRKGPNGQVVCRQNYTTDSRKVIVAVSHNCPN